MGDNQNGKVVDFDQVSTDGSEDGMDNTEVFDVDEMLNNSQQQEDAKLEAVKVVETSMNIRHASVNDDVDVDKEEIEALKEKEKQKDQEEEEEEYKNASASELLSLSKGAISYRALLRRLVDEMPEIPSCNVEFKNVDVVVNVPVNTSDKVKTVGNAVTGIFTKVANMRKKKETRPVFRLHDVSVNFPAGTSTLVLAPPGHGKTSLLQTIAGIVKPTKGEILFNGKNAKDSDLKVNRITGFVGQDDLHMPQLTVRETFMFAAQNANVSAGLPDTELVRRYTKERVELLLRILGLNNCADTIVGNDVVRGVSGGEKRRVSIGEQLITNARVLLLDQYSTGLDASTTIDISRSLCAWAHITGGTVITTLLQPPPEVVEMYDNIVVLREGKIVYAGPREQLQPYFNHAGFYCPEEMDTADFVTEVVTHPHLWVHKFKEGHISHHDTMGTSVENIPITSHKMHLYYKSKSDELMPAIPKPGSATKAGVEGVINDGELKNSYSKAQYGRSHSKSFAEHFGFNVQRQFNLMRRNPQFLIAHIVQSVGLTLILGSLFWDLDPDNFQMRMGFLLFIPSMLAFNNMAELSVAIAARGVVHRQQFAGFYSTLAYTLAVNVVHLPLAIIETVIFSSGVYWMTGFAGDVDRFFFFILNLSIIAVASAGLFRFISYSVPSIDLGQVLVGPAVGILIMFCGIPITRSNIPPFFIWVYYLSPFSWSIRSLAINEYGSSAFRDIIPGTNTTRGDLYMSAYELQTGEDWKWYGIIYLFAFLAVTIAMCDFLLRRGKPTGSRGTSRVVEVDDENASISYADLTEKQEEEEEEELASSVIDKGLPNETVVAIPPPKESALPFERVSLVFRKLCYDVPVKDDKGHKSTRRLLNNVAGYARAGELTALMGVTGAGKTTLLDVLARRKTGGEIHGAIRINGMIPSTSRFASLVGYCEQNDLHEPFSTVYEALSFSAALRLPASVSPKKRKEFVNEVMELIELSHLSNRVIGWPGQDAGLSQGQRKRLTLGVELVANTSILFLDEPTSGLDSREAEVVMRVVRNVCRTGRTVVCTIHQPNAELFDMFDQLLLLARGGKPVFHGPIADLQNYFEAMEGVEKKASHVNPATWMLDVIGASSAGAADVKALEKDGTDSVRVKETKKALTPEDFPRIYEDSSLRESVRSEISKLLDESKSRRASMEEDAKVDDKKVVRPSKGIQFWAVFHRAAVSSWRNIDYNLLRIIAIIAMAVIFGLLYVDVDTSQLAGVVSKMASIFSTGMFCGFVSLLAAIPLIVGLRPVVARERSSRMYSGWMQSVALLIMETPYLLFSGFVSAIVFYFITQLEVDAEIMILYWLAHTVVGFLLSYVSHLMAYTFPSAESATLGASSVVSLLFLFGGVFVPGPGMAPGYHWIWTINFLRHTLPTMVVPQFYCDSNNGTVACPTVLFATAAGPQQIVVSDYVQDFLGVSYDTRWESFYGMLGYAAGFIIVIVLSAQYINYVKR